MRPCLSAAVCPHDKVFIDAWYFVLLLHVGNLNTNLLCIVEMYYSIGLTQSIPVNRCDPSVVMDPTISLMVCFHKSLK